MSKKSRQNGHGPERLAIERDVAPEPPPAGVQLTTIPIADRPLRMAPSGKMRLETPADPTTPMVLVFDANAGSWNMILLPANAKWILQADGTPAPALWTPGSPK